MFLITNIRCFLIMIVIIAVVAPVGGCHKKTDDGAKGKIKVVTTLFPLFEFAKQIGGHKAEVTLLLPPGVEAHSFEPRPGDIIKMEAADLFIYTGDEMEPWVKRVLSGIEPKRFQIIDASSGIALQETGQHHEHESAEKHAENHSLDEKSDHHHGKLDPHIWLDFSNAQKMVDSMTAGFVTKDPANKDFYLKNASTYRAKLDSLDHRYRETMATCKKKVIIHGGHFAFNYLANRYGLIYESAYAGSPDSEPTPKRIIELKTKIRKQGLDTVFYEELVEPRMSDMIAKETGCKLLKLHGAHNVSKDEIQDVSFIQLMEQNLENLRVGLQCTKN
ncbi:MAG TPA: zinc ABC transporter substrate-binding protein [Syntrophorhabdaceae bacterium]|nr:zinc ABC transporter substrate-binding protein [Syntrophorhabdaceae bacterium]